MAQASVSLPPEDEAFVEDQLRSGAFGSREALFREAVRVLHRQRDEQQMMARLNARLTLGTDQLDHGEGERVTDLDAYFDGVQAQARRG